MFLATAGTAFAASPAIQLTGSTPISNTQVKLEAFYSLGDAQSLDLYFYWDNICGVFANQSQAYTVNSASGYISYTVTVPQSGTYCYKVSGMKHMADGTSDFIDSGSPSSKVFTTTNTNNNTSAPAVQNTGATSVTNTSALLNAYYTSGNSSTSNIYFMYGTSNQGAINKSSEIAQSSTSGDVATTISGLSANTTYVYRAYIRTSYGTVSAVSDGTFTTTGGTVGSGCYILNFSADSSSIYAGGSTTLRWDTVTCSSVSITNIGSVNVDGSTGTGALYSTTTYTLTASNSSSSDTKTISIGVLPNNNNNNSNPCNPTSLCYWNGSSWVYYSNNNNNQNNYPSCYYTYTCYWNGSTWVTTNNNNNNYYPNNNGNTYSGTYPSCYYDATCYWSGSTWVYNAGGNVNGNYSPYTYNPNPAYTGGPNYVYKTVGGKVNTVYVDQEVTQYQNPGNVVSYNNGYYGDIMSRYNPDYRSNANDRLLLTGSAATAGQITLIGLLIALIIIAIIVYMVRSSQTKEKIH